MRVASLMENIKQTRRVGCAMEWQPLAVSLLGLGVAGSVAPHWCRSAHDLDDNGRDDRPCEANTSRGSERARLDPAKVKSLADQRAELLSKIDSQVSEASTGQVGTSARTRLSRTSPPRPASRPSCYHAAKVRQPISSLQRKTAPRSRLPARSRAATASPPAFGQVGPWARYHTGLDFSSPVGTPLHAPASGVVTNAGIGPASGWAGNYVAIKYPDGTHTLMAHMSTVSVSVGQTVSACQLVGADRA